MTKLPNRAVYERGSKDDTLAPKYKPRYQIEETSVEIRQKQGKLSICSHLGECCCKCLYSITKCISPRCIFSICCGSRRRLALLIIFSAFLSCLVNLILLEPLALSIGNYRNFSLAKKQSYGFFEDIPQSRWKLLQKRVRDQRKKYRKRRKIIVPDPSHYGKPSQFYQHNWQADFTCPHEERIGAMKDGGKYVCDPRSILLASKDRLENHHGNGCLLYISSANVNEYKFEEALMETIGDCEIHVFSPNTELETGSSPNGIYLHPWGFRGSDSNTNNDPNKFKTFGETLQTLGHCGKTIDVFSLDCEGCEFYLFKDLFRDHDKGTEGNCIAAALMQILVQVHGAPTKRTNEFFATFQNEGYVTFRKGPSLEASGNHQDYGFLKLSDDFFH